MFNTVGPIILDDVVGHRRLSGRPNTWSPIMDAALTRSATWPTDVPNSGVDIDDRQR